MRIIIFTSLFAGMLLSLASCSKNQYQALFQQKKNLNDTTAQASDITLVKYKIRPADILQIRNLQNSKNIVDLNPAIGGNNAVADASATQGSTDNYLVEEDGTVALTGLGRVQVGGLTRLEAQKMIEDLYRKILTAPIIEVKILNLKVTLFGEVRSTGNVTLTKDKTTLVEVIGTAGGLTEKANETNVKIIRGSQKNPQVIQIDLSDIRSINDPKAILQSGDIIYVTQNKRAIRNDNYQNLSFFIQPALLLFNTALIIISLIRR